MTLDYTDVDLGAVICAKSTGKILSLVKENISFLKKHLPNIDNYFFELNDIRKTYHDLKRYKSLDAQSLLTLGLRVLHLRVNYDLLQKKLNPSPNRHVGHGSFSVDSGFCQSDIAAGAIIQSWAVFNEGLIYCPKKNESNYSRVVKYKKHPYCVNLSNRLGPLHNKKPISLPYSQSSPDSEVMYVITKDYQLIVGAREGSQRDLPHPTLVGGFHPQVLSGGIVHLKDGKIKRVEVLASGHFKPNTLGSIEATLWVFLQVIAPAYFHPNFDGFRVFDRSKPDSKNWLRVGPLPQNQSSNQPNTNLFKTSNMQVSTTPHPRIISLHKKCLENSQNINNIIKILTCISKLDDNKKRTVLKNKISAAVIKLLKTANSDKDFIYNLKSNFLSFTYTSESVTPKHITINDIIISATEIFRKFPTPSNNIKNIIKSQYFANICKGITEFLLKSSRILITDEYLQIKSQNKPCSPKQKKPNAYVPKEVRQHILSGKIPDVNSHEKWENTSWLRRKFILNKLGLKGSSVEGSRVSSPATVNISEQYEMIMISNPKNFAELISQHQDLKKVFFKCKENLSYIKSCNIYQVYPNKNVYMQRTWCTRNWIKLGQNERKKFLNILKEQPNVTITHFDYEESLITAR